MSLDTFFIARPEHSAQEINEQLARGRNLLLTPGVYRLEQALRVIRPDPSCWDWACRA